MTRLNRTIKRMSGATTHRGRRIAVTIEPGNLIGLREERTRKTFYLTIDAAYELAVMAELRAARREKAKAKAEAKKIKKEKEKN